MYQIKFTPNDKGNPPGKLADAEIHFTFTIGEAGLMENETDRPGDELLTGLKLVGFAVWETRNRQGRSVTFPARQYSINGERRSFALLRPIEHADAQLKVRDAILDAYAKYERLTRQLENMPNAEV